MKRLTFEVLGPRAGCRTQRWTVLSAAGESSGHTLYHVLGRVTFKATWRRYVFEPEGGTTFDVSCLREVIDFIDQQMAARKAAQ